MDTLIEEDSPTPMIVLLVIVFLIFVVGGGLGLAYAGGVFTGKNEALGNAKGALPQASLTEPAH